MKRDYLIYRIKFPNNKSYIGLTHNLEKRQEKHRFDALSDKPTAQKYAVHRAILKYGYENIKWEILVKLLTKEEAKLEEIRLIKEYRTFEKEYGYNLTKGGDVGKTIYTDEQILEDARKYETIRDWRNNIGNSLYSTAKNRDKELFRRCKEHMKRARGSTVYNRRYITDEMLMEESKKYTSPDEFRLHNEAWYILSSRRRLLGCMEFSNRQRIARSYEEIKLEASSYKRLQDWKVNSYVTFSYAYRKGWMDSIKKELGFIKHGLRG